MRIIFCVFFSLYTVAASAIFNTGVTTRQQCLTNVKLEVSAKQRYQMDGKVDIDVILVGEINEIADIECRFVATNNITHAEIPIEHITQDGVITVMSTNLIKHFVWDARADVGELKIDDITLWAKGNAKVRDDIADGVQLWENGPYWAECNIGATNPEEYGYYFWWGGTIGYRCNSGNNGLVSVNDGEIFAFSINSRCQTWRKYISDLQTQGYIDQALNLRADHDAATVYLGAPWRMPTRVELDMLGQNCTITWTKMNGVNGRLVTGKGAYSTKSIFLPAAGYAYESYLRDRGSRGAYWSSSPDTDNFQEAISCDFNSERFGCGNYFSRYRYHGRTIRPVRELVGVMKDVGYASSRLSLDCRMVNDDSIKAMKVTVLQRYPWDGMVNVDVIFNGESNEVEKVGCVFVATNNISNSSIRTDHIARGVVISGSGRKWVKRFVWNIIADVGEENIDDISLYVKANSVDARSPITKGVQLWKDGPYWAECNVGATKPEEYGYYFWWGDTIGYKRNLGNSGWISTKTGLPFSFYIDNCPTYYKSNATLFSEGYIDSTGSLAAKYDAATAQWGSPWRMPTSTEIDALINNCTTMWITTNGVCGMLVVGKGAYCSKSIFLPATGSAIGSSFSLGDSLRGAYSSYWSSTFDEETSYGDRSDYSWLLYFDSNNYYSDSFGLFRELRYFGCSIRPVQSLGSGIGSTSGSTKVIITHFSFDCESKILLPPFFLGGMRVGVPVYDEIRSTDYVSLKVSGLPAGIKVTGDSKGGAILSGAAKTAGSYMVTISYQGNGRTRSKCYELIVDKAPHLKLSLVAGKGGSVKGGGDIYVDKKTTVVATSAKGCVFAGWYFDSDFTNPYNLGSIDFRSPSMTIVNTESEDAFASLYARFVPAEFDRNIGLVINGSGVMDNSAETVINTSGTLTLALAVDSLSLPKAAVSGLPAGLKFDTKTNRISGTATKPGAYIVTVKLTNATVKKAIEKKFTIVVDNLTAANDAFVARLDNAPGEKYSLSAGVVDLSMLPSLELWSSTAKLAVSGLPAGLKYNAKTDAIEGVATKAGIYTVYLTVTEGKTKTISTITIEVAALPAWAVGTFDGLMIDGDGFNYGATITVSAAGKITAKLIGVSMTRTISGYLTKSVDDYYVADLMLNEKGMSASVSLIIRERLATGSGQIQGTVSGDFGADSTTAVIEANQNTWPSETLALPVLKSGVTYWLDEGNCVCSVKVGAKGKLTVGVYDDYLAKKPVGTGSAQLAVWQEGEGWLGRIPIYVVTNKTLAQGLARWLDISIAADGTITFGWPTHDPLPLNWHVGTYSGRASDYVYLSGYFNETMGADVTINVKQNGDAMAIFCWDDGSRDTFNLKCTGGSIDTESCALTASYTDVLQGAKLFYDVSMTINRNRGGTPTASFSANSSGYLYIRTYYGYETVYYSDSLGSSSLLSKTK